MFFALINYKQYRLRVGPYGNKQRDGALRIAYVDRLPKAVIDNLKVGDAIFTQRLDSVWSWGTMYFASSPIDHAAVYVGDGRALHMTLSGSRHSSVAALARGARILPVRIGSIKHFNDETAEPSADGGYIDSSPRLLHVFTPKVQLLWVAILLLIGFFPERFRWQHLADLWIISMLIDGLLYSALGVFGLTAMTALVSVFALYWRVAYRLGRKARMPYRRLSHPDIGYRAFYKVGGYIFTSAGTLVIVPGFGILPADAFEALNASLGLSRQSADYSADDKLECLDQVSCNSVKNRDVEICTNKSESKYEKHDNKEQIEKRSDGPGNSNKKSDG